MRSREFLFGGVIVIFLWILTYITELPFFLAINLFLVVFYILYLRGKLPINYYYGNNKIIPLYEKISIILGIVFLILVLSRVTPSYFKLIGRIGFYPFLIYTAGIIFYAFIMKIFSEMPMSTFKRYLGVYLRSVLIIFSNIVLVSSLIYTIEVNYKGGVLHHKIIHDGDDEYVTTFNDSLKMYQTKVCIRDSDPNIDYIIYYNHYPDNIHHIDTLMIKNKINRSVCAADK